MMIQKRKKKEFKKIVHPLSVSNIRFEGTRVEESVVKGVVNYFVLILVIFVAGTFVLSIDTYGDFETNVTAMAACLNNVGPGFSKVGPIGNFSGFNVISKLVLAFSMLIGRLEIYPMLLLFNPKVWMNK